MASSFRDARNFGRIAASFNAIGRCRRYIGAENLLFTSPRTVTDKIFINTSEMPPRAKCWSACRDPLPSMRQSYKERRISARSTPLCRLTNRRMVLSVPIRIGLWSGTGIL